MSNVRVGVRFRPFNKLENEHDPGGMTVELDKSTVHVVDTDNEDHAKRKFVVDHVFDPATTQSDFYDVMARPIVEDFLRGYNCTIFAYGQTGSGKSFSTFGERGHEEGGSGGWSEGPLRGVVPRALCDVFDSLEELHDVATVEVTVSFLELYKEVISDLLKKGNSGLRIREPPSGDLYVEDLTELHVLSAGEAMAILEKGSSERHTAATRMNATSSRSHCVFTVALKQQKLDGSVVRSKVHFVDLAGSEMVKKTHADGERLEEAKAINKSLTTLAKVINALTDPKPIHPPFRDSQLTRLLKPALGGNSKTSVIIACSPHKYNYHETLSSLRFAERAKRIVNASKLNIELTREQLAELVESLKADLKKMTWMYLTLKETGQDPMEDAALMALGPPSDMLDVVVPGSKAGDDSGAPSQPFTLEGLRRSSAGPFPEESEGEEGEEGEGRREEGGDGEGPFRPAPAARHRASSKSAPEASAEVARYVQRIQEKDDEIASLKEELKQRESEYLGHGSANAVESYKSALGGKDRKQASLLSSKSETHVALLSSVRVFAKLLESEVRQLSGIAVEKTFKKGDVVLHAGDTDTVLVVQAGEVAEVEGGRTTRQHKTGASVGELCLLGASGALQGVSVVCVSATCSVLQLSRPRMETTLGPVMAVVRKECAHAHASGNQPVLLHGTVLELSAAQLVKALKSRGVDLGDVGEGDDALPELRKLALAELEKEYEDLEERLAGIQRDLTKQKAISAKLARDKWQLEHAGAGGEGVADQRRVGNVKVVRPFGGGGGGGGGGAAAGGEGGGGSGGGGGRAGIPMLQLKQANLSGAKAIPSGSLSARGPVSARSQSLRTPLKPPISSARNASLKFKTINILEE